MKRMAEHVEVVPVICLFCLCLCGILCLQPAQAVAGQSASQEPLAGDRRLPDDEIVVTFTSDGFFSNNAYYPDTDLALGPAHTTETEAMDASDDVAVATGKMHTTSNEEYFVVFLATDGSIVVEGWDPATGSHFGPASWSGITATGDKHVTCDAADFDGDGTDELLVGFQGGGDYLNLLVIDGTGSGFEKKTHFLDTTFEFRDGLVKDFDTAALDADDDGTAEIAVVCGDDCPGYVPWYYVAVRLYDVAADFSITYQSRSVVSLLAIDRHSQTKTIAVGDFDGEPGDDIIAAALELTDEGASDEQIAMKVFTVDADLNLVEKGHAVQWAWVDVDTTGIHMAVGDLDSDGTDEAVLCWSAGLWNGVAESYIKMFDISEEYAISGKGYSEVSVYGNQYMNLAVGNFDGTLDFRNEIAAVWQGDNNKGVVRIYQPSKTLDILTAKGKDSSLVLAGGRRITLASGDFDGDSLYLGEPVHWVAEEHHQPSAIITEPPKHIDYIKDPKGDLREYNVSRTWFPPDDYFSTVLKDENETVITTSNTATSSWSLGVKVSVDIEDDFEMPLIGSVGVKLENTAGYEYDQHKEEMNKNYTKTEMGVGLRASSDDFLVAKIMNVHVWRYPVLGHYVDTMASLFGMDLSDEMKYELEQGIIPGELKTAFTDAGHPLSPDAVLSTIDGGWKITDGTAAYFMVEDADKLIVNQKTGNKGQLYIQISLPSDETKGNLEGRTVEWYQPVHENGNIFSYPWEKEQIGDLARGEILTGLETFAVGGGQAEFHIEWTKAEEQEEEVSTEHKFEQDSSITGSVKVVDMKTSITVKESYDRTWSQLTTSETECTESKGITITKPDMDDSCSYEFTPLIFSTGVHDVTEDGTTVKEPTGALKVGYTVDPVSTAAAQWWTDISGYGDNADPALNLPYRWVSKDGGVTWEYNEGSYNLQMMKGLFLFDNTGSEIGYMVKEGDLVTLRARVYNYSFVDADQVTVAFEAQASDDNRNWGQRFTIDKDTIAELPAFQNPQDIPNWKFAEVTFDTSGKAGKYYRLWVIVDPGDTVKEVTGHNLGEKYSNNEGYFGIPLAVVSADDMTASKELGVVALEPLALSDDNVTQGDTVMVTFMIKAEEEDHGTGRALVLFYDGHPASGGTLFDIELVPFLFGGRSCQVQVPYSTHGKAGTHTLYAVVRSRPGEGNADDNMVSTKLRVRSGNDEGDGCFIRTVLP
ncbi:MAG: hypothetical protein JXO48_02800 [Deltaproteobacteria bacterium]|nr:hypothetical protein [Deltaproteobacteria bacterium]